MISFVQHGLFGQFNLLRQKRLDDFYTWEKIYKLRQTSINEINCNMGNTIVEYKTYLKIPKRATDDEQEIISNFKYGEKYKREFTFTGYISARNPDGSLRDKDHAGNKTIEDNR